VWNYERDGIGNKLRKQNMFNSKSSNRSPRASRRTRRAVQQQGFTIIETCIAMVILMVAALASASLFVYSIQNNSGASDRELAMAVAQQEMERLRNVAFTDASLNATATAGVTSTVTSASRKYTVVKTITNSNTVNGAPTIKTITIQVTPVGTYLGTVGLRTQRATLVKGP
jgi:Tfp pilus assembly protein PilV